MYASMQYQDTGFIKFWFKVLQSKLCFGFTSNHQRSMFISMILIAELYIKEMFTIFDSNS